MILSNRLFGKLLLWSVGLYAVSILVLVSVLTHRQEVQYMDSLRSQLRTAASLLSDQAEERILADKQDTFQELVERVSRQSGMRITVIALDGNVLADSDESPERMENHGDRPEVVAALRDGSGSALRFSHTLTKEMLYVAQRVDIDHHPTAFVRVALPTEQINDYLAGTYQNVVLLALLVSTVAVATIYAVVSRIVGPIAELTAAAEAIEGGDYEHSVEVSSHDELGVLADAFSRMSRELKTRIEQLRENGQRLATVLGSMVEGVIAVDERQDVLFVNDAARRLLRLSEGELAARPLLEVVRFPAVAHAVNQALADRKPVRDEFELPDSPRRVVALQANRLPGTPCPGVVLVLHDVSDLRRLESLRQEFVANVSHELKTPLSSIKAYTETLLAGALHDDSINEEFLRHIEEQADRLHALILDMLSLARIESGREAYDITRVDVGRLINNCLSQYQAAAAAKQIELSADGADGIFVRADEDGLVTILNNLVDNALKYTPEGGHVSLRCHSEQREAILEVNDTGIGIAETDQARIFERFYRVDKARSREMGGTGLGLSIVKHLTQAFGGSVSVESTKGQGSTFRVRLPLF